LTDEQAGADRERVDEMLQRADQFPLALCGNGTGGRAVLSRELASPLGPEPFGVAAVGDDLLLQRGPERPL
jgi:hypothetical protein